jgi:site-specific DNA-methyltransferase (adenine-specific)
LEFKDISKESYYHDKTGMLLKGDCLEWMAKFPDKSVDMILCDLPYGTTACKWDVVIPFDKLWEQYERIVKDGGCIALFGNEPFSSYLRISNIKKYKYDWIWDKVKPSSGLRAKIKPLEHIEYISIFNTNKYYPIMTEKKQRSEWKEDSNGEAFGGKKIKRFHDNKGLGYPKQLLTFSKADQHQSFHPTWKPIELYEYLIKTYTNENEIVLDNCSGGGTNIIASKNTNRKWICIEQEQKYCDTSVDRIKNWVMKSEV